MDLDCIGSMVLAKRLFPEHKLVLSRLIHPQARAVFNLYQDQFGFLSVKDIKKDTLESVVIVDTKSLARVNDILGVFANRDVPMEIFDHHAEESGEDFPDALMHNCPYGANVTQLALALMERGDVLTPAEATLALAGVYSDTGFFKYQNVTPEDFSAAAYFMRCGASVNVLSKYMHTLKEDYQIDVFRKLISNITYKEISGHFIILSELKLDKQEGGLAAVVEKLCDVEHPDAAFGIFHFHEETNILIVARSATSEINCDAIMSYFGGGGHTGAASALIKHEDVDSVVYKLNDLLLTQITPAVSAKDIMQPNVLCIKNIWNMMQASLFLEKIDHSGAPVVNEEKKLIGMITLKDIMQARRAGQMNAPVSAYMKSKLITCEAGTSLRKVEDILYKGNIGHLPVMRGDDMIGFITRTDIIRLAEKKKPSE